MMQSEYGNRVKTEKYRDRVKILMRIPGVGVITSMEILLELQAVTRFRRAGSYFDILRLKVAKPLLNSTVLSLPIKHQHFSLLLTKSKVIVL